MIAIAINYTSVSLRVAKDISLIPDTLFLCSREYILCHELRNLDDRPSDHCGSSTLELDLS